MLNCEQTKGQTIYQHGMSVCKYTFQLIEDLKCKNKNEDWKLPEWIFDYSSDLLLNIHEDGIISKYAIFHDVGKPFCREVDENGKVHFPDHANVSKKTFLSATNDHTISNLIGWDMDLHTLSSTEIEQKCKIEWSIKDACTLLLVAFAEIHSNASLFGGIASTSFKIKFKQLEKRGKQICKYYFGEKKKMAP